MDTNRGLEVLAPAGNLDILKGVVNAGADAVYFGGDLFGARAYAANFSLQDAEEGIRYAHLFGARTYLTVNTLLKNLEIEKKLHDYLSRYADLGIDAVIVQDMAVLDMLRTDFPNIAIHASTQMSLCGCGAKLMQDLGVTRVVTARELSLPEIRAIYDSTGMEIETFVHGALCYSYSGQCLFSSLAGGRSGNRGRCAQPCRQAYEVFEEHKKVKTPGPYVLSPKDLCGIHDLKSLYDAGVYSLKIEGRMKQREYACGVVSLYRKYADLLMEDPSMSPVVSKEDYDRLLHLGNRCGFTDDYYSKANSREMITFVDPSHKKQEEDAALPDRKIAVKGCLHAHVGEAVTFTLSCEKGSVTVTGERTEKAEKQPITEEDVIKKLNAFGNTVFALDQLDLDMDADAFLPAKSLKNLRRCAAEKLEEIILESNQRKGIPAQKNMAMETYPKFAGRRSLQMEDAADPRRNLFVYCRDRGQLQAAVDYDFVGTLCLDYSAACALRAQEVHKIRKKGKKLYVRFPDIMRHLSEELLSTLKNAGQLFDGALVPSYDGLEWIREYLPDMDIVCDHRLYTYSNQALAAFRKMGLTRFCAPVELNLGEHRHRDNSDSQMIVYGYLPLMITAGCMNRSTVGCTHQSARYELRDQKNHSFTYVNDCNICTSTLYNSDVLCLFEELDHLSSCGFAQYRMDFTIENAQIIRQVMDSYGNMLSGNKLRLPKELAGHITKGHLYRGVE